MNSYLVYRASFYLMLVLASLALVGETAEGQFAKLYTVAVALCGIAAFFTVDLHRRWALPRPLANALAVGTLGLLYLEYKVDETQMIQALGHWLIYLQLVKYFLPKTAEDDWFLFLLGLMQVLIGSVINQSDQVGTWLFLWAMMAVWVLGQFFLQREAQRLLPAQDMTAESYLTSPRVDPYDGLFDVPYVVATVRVLATTLALGGLIFLVLPRRAGATRSQANAPMARHLTGFDEEVQLGQLGEILENDSVVMSVELTDDDDKAIRPVEEPLWRGVTMLRYDKGRWHRQSKPTQAVVSFRREARTRTLRKIHQKITLEPNDSATLFGIRPMLDAISAHRFAPHLSTNDGTLFRADQRGGDYEYEVVSDADMDALQPHESPPGESHTLLLSIPAELRPRLQAIAEPLVANIEAEDQAGISARARKLEFFLRDSGQFSYTLQMDVIDRNVDPVEDFLVNRKKGHCEYFASALALLLRSVDIPSRLVNGFKGGDWNELTETMNVRQKHAHSWVEAYIGLTPGPDRAPIWITLDPTPASERQESIAHVGGIAGSFRPITDAIRHIWVFYVVGFDGERQNRLLYAPMRTIIQEIRNQYMSLGQFLRKWFKTLFHFPTISAFISIRGFIVSFVVLTLAAGLAHVAFRLARRFLSWLRGNRRDATSLTAGVLSYRRLVQVLAIYDLKRNPAETQSEFARRAQKFLIGRGSTTQLVADVPQRVVDAFYRVRFGHLELEPALLEELDLRIDALETSLKSR